MIDPAPDDDLPDLGPCCACRRGGADGVRVRNIVMVAKKGLEPGTGWGCVVCHLPPDGAYAALCDACLEAGAEILEACVGYPGEARRCAITELTEAYDHNRAAHDALYNRAALEQ